MYNSHMEPKTTLPDPRRLIPYGDYCYDIVRIDAETGRITVRNCPFWSLRDDKPSQENGYCSYLQEGDWEQEGLSLLWDQIKECGINKP